MKAGSRPIFPVSVVLNTSFPDPCRLVHCGVRGSVRMAARITEAEVSIVLKMPGTRSRTVVGKPSNPISTTLVQRYRAGNTSDRLNGADRLVVSGNAVMFDQSRKADFYGRTGDVPLQPLQQSLVNNAIRRGWCENPSLFSRFWYNFGLDIPVSRPAPLLWDSASCLIL